MEFSEKWLREWINPNVNISVLCDQITELGIEVEKVIKVSSVCSNLIVGEIIECLQRYSSMELFLVKVNIGRNKHIHVISRKIDFVQGMKVVIATKISKLFDYTFMSLIKSKGIKFNGIICFYEDIGITNLDTNIVKLPLNSVVGTDICKYLFLDDNIIKISSTPNRSDALSILGIARNVAAQNDLPLPSLKKYPVLENSCSNRLEISIDIPNICFRFLGRIISNVNTKNNTPFWMLEKLKRSSIEPSNIIKNIINYVLIELGQPLYIMNLNSILKRVVVRTSYKNENFINKDNRKVVIDDNIIVISDEEKILVLGGHINSYASDINLNVKNLFLGCGSYNNFNVLKQSLKYGCKNIFTERYERGIDFNIQYNAIEYATYLILKLCGGEASSITTEIKNNKIFNKKTIKLFRKKLYKIVGYVINDEIVIHNLTKLGFKITVYNKHWLIVPPSWRFDIDIEEDVISELLRILGYKNVSSIPISTCSNIVHNNEIYITLNRIKLFLVDQGYHEVITYGFVDPNFQKLFFPDIAPLYLSNPISKEMSSMRVSLWTGLLSSVIYNQNRQENRLRFFESGLCFLQDSQENLGIKQSLYLSGVLSGYKNKPHWDSLDKQVDFYDLKGDVESIMDLLGKLHLVTFKRFSISGLHPNQSVAIYFKNKKIGIMGTISPDLEKKLNLKGKTVIFELIWDDIASFHYMKIKKISEYPRSVRDISIIVDETIPVEDIIKTCQKCSSGRIVEVNLFDIFRGDKIGIGKKSLALRFTFESKKHTFTEKDISRILKTCITALELKFKAMLRKDL
ncbi:MAG: phenylalanine--tRNA ligase subunit beta [Buchnera aphidicola (Floraphis meitanensis)]